MNPSTVDIVKATAPLIKAHGEQITQRMYELAFECRPDVRQFFVNSWMVNPEEGRLQARLLALAVYAYAAHIDELDVLSDTVERVAQKHVTTKILPETYPVIGECLLTAIKDVLGEAATPEVLGAWSEAYGALADIFIQREREIYAERGRELFPIAAARKA